MNLARKQTKCSYSPTDELIGQQNISENCEITDPKSVADAFNNYFAKIGSNLASSIPAVLQKLPVSLSHLLYVILCFCPQMKSNNKQSNFKLVRLWFLPVSIPISILKILNCGLTRPLQLTFNTSFRTGIVAR